MKWTVAGAGALLSVAGVYALTSGGSIIQVERGWATFIAGAVLLGAGVIVMAIAALMDRIDRLAAVSRVGMAPPRPQIEALGKLKQPLPEPAPVPAPALREAGMERAPMPDRAAPQPAPVPPAAPLLHGEPAEQERPAALRNFQFVFPAEAAHEAPPPAPPEPEAGPSEIERIFEAPAERRSGLEWLRRSKPAPAAPAPAAEPAPPPEPSRPEPAPAQDAFEIAHEALFGAAPPVEPAPPVMAEPAPALAAAPRLELKLDLPAEPKPEAKPEPKLELKPEPKQAMPDPFGTDWLERAIAGADEPDEPSSRMAPHSIRRAAIEQKRREEAETVVEPAPEPALKIPEPEPLLPFEPEAPAPIEIGRYRANDVAYIMFSDGSITAETPAGASYRFNSLPELRAFIERGGN